MFLTKYTTATLQFFLFHKVNDQNKINKKLDLKRQPTSAIFSLLQSQTPKIAPLFSEGVEVIGPNNIYCI